MRKDLFGPGRDKTEFLIFDHWKNFWFFDEKYKETQPSPQKSLLQHLFEARVELAEAALDKMDQHDLRGGRRPDRSATSRAVRDTNAIDARDKWKELETAGRRRPRAPVRGGDEGGPALDRGPAQQWRNIRGDEDAYRFDLLDDAARARAAQGRPERA